MLILIGTVPTAYALNRALPESQVAQFQKTSEAAAKVVAAKGAGHSIIGDPRPAVTQYVAAHKISEGTYPSLAVLVKDVGDQVQKYGSLNKVPAEAVGNTRNDMYLTSEAIRFLMKDKENDLNKEEVATLNAYKGSLDSATKFIPTWVKVAVAIALGLGTMIGWKRIVITVGEKIGKTHLTYAQGASAELVAAATIGAADMFGLPVSTTHVLSSGVAGTMAANGSGLQFATIRNMLMAWVLTLPVAIMLSGSLYLHLRPSVLRRRSAPQQRSSLRCNEKGPRHRAGLFSWAPMNSAARCDGLGLGSTGNFKELRKNKSVQRFLGERHEIQGAGIRRHVVGVHVTAIGRGRGQEEQRVQHRPARHPHLWSARHQRRPLWCVRPRRSRAPHRRRRP